MGAPQGGQKNYVEKPAHVFGEQYRVGQPLPVGAVPELGPVFPPEGGPYVNTSTGCYPLHDTDWVITNQRTGFPQEVLTDEVFTERFGHGNVADLTPAKE